MDLKSPLSTSRSQLISRSQQPPQQMSSSDFLNGKSKKSLLSFSDLSQLFNGNLKKGTQIPLKCGSYVASIGSSLHNQVDTIADMMKLSRGRDKICNFIQYITDFYYVCNKNSNIPYIQSHFKQDQLVATRVAKKIRDSMKSGRKIFKFLKFIGEFNNFMKVLKSGKPLSLKATVLLCVLCRFFYYVLDNILWAISIGNLSEIFARDLSKRVKSLKDSFLLTKAFLKIAEASYAFLFKRNKEKAALQKLAEGTDQSAQISQDKNVQELCTKVLNVKHKRRLKTVKLLTTCIRILMLCKRQNIAPFNHLMNNINYSFFGLVCSTVGLSKSLLGRKVDIISIEKKRSGHDIREYEELSQKQYEQFKKIPQQQSRIKRSDSTLSDLLSMGSDDSLSSDSSFDDGNDDNYDNSRSDYDDDDFNNNNNSNDGYNDEDYANNSDGGSVHNLIISQPYSQAGNKKPKLSSRVHSRMSMTSSQDFNNNNNNNQCKKKSKLTKTERILASLKVATEPNDDWWNTELNWELEADKKENNMMNLVFAKDMIPRKPKRANTCDSRERLR